jgi:antitoxin HicB
MTLRDRVRDIGMNEKVGPLPASLIRQGGEANVDAAKRVLARQIQWAMQERLFTKAEMARRMRTSWAALDRLLDPNYQAVTLNTLRKAAIALDCELRVEFGVIKEARARSFGEV